jgi:hypothetical protein
MRIIASKLLQLSPSDSDTNLSVDPLLGSQLLKQAFNFDSERKHGIHDFYQPRPAWTLQITSIIVKLMRIIA